MAKVEKITVALSEDTLSVVRDAVASGEYASAGEVVRDALRDWKVKHRLSRIELDEMRRRRDSLVAGSCSFNKPRPLRFQVARAAEHSGGSAAGHYLPGGR